MDKTNTNTQHITKQQPQRKQLLNVRSRLHSGLGLAIVPEYMIRMRIRKSISNLKFGQSATLRQQTTMIDVHVQRKSTIVCTLTSQSLPDTWGHVFNVHM